MRKINRNQFLKNSLKTGAVVMLTPLHTTLFSQVVPIMDHSLADDFLIQFVKANDVQVAALLKMDFTTIPFSRKLGHYFTLLAASYCTRQSVYFHHSSIVHAMHILSQRLLQAQAADGTVNIGNLESPPDTAFLIELITAASFPLSNEKEAALIPTMANLKNFMLKAGEGLVVGGVHTPNHRWVVCAALARLNALYPNRKYVDRINDWLGEGIYINSDGNYPERSRIYSYVENNAIVSIARLLNKPALLEPVRKNLESTYFYMEPNGELVTVDSRRQDQYMKQHILNYYLLYRYFAIKENNGTFAAIAGQIEGMKGFDEAVLSTALIHFLEEPLLQKKMPQPVQPPVNYEKLFSQSHLLRIRRGTTTSTFFGGADWPLIIASGRSNSPNFFAYRKGNAVLEYIRLSTNFFSTGYFYSEGLKVVDKRYVLYKKLEVPYYQPLPKNKRNEAGDYELSESTDNRFWNKMDFENRAVSNVKTMETTISLTENNGSHELEFAVSGQAGVQVTIELCFAEGGKLSGVSSGEKGIAFLKNEMGKYEFDGDVIHFGPGTFSHQSVDKLEGERYSTHFGNLRTEGMHVYLTGLTPFTHTLTFS